MLFWDIWALPIGRNKIHKGLQMGWMYVPVSKLENKPLTESLDHSFRRNGSNQPENSFFMLFRGFGAHPNGPEKVIKGRQVGGRYVPMSKLENKPHTKSSGLFL